MPGAVASDWIQRWAHLVPAGGEVLDVACGSGRHMRWFAARGHAVTGIDRDAAALQPLAAIGRTVCADLENAPWPAALAGRQFAAVVVTHYLWRPLFADLLASLAPGGVLLYETFAQGHEHLGRPSRAEFLLAPGELLRHCARLHVVAYEQGLLAQPPRLVQRIAALRPDPSAPLEPVCDLFTP